MFLAAKNPKKTIQGQALLIVVLGMAVILTVVLSIVARSTTDIGITTKDEEYTRAFSAAEAGVEKGLIFGESSGTLANNASFTTEVTDIAEGLSDYNIPGDFYSGEVATVWFVSHDENNNLTCSGRPCFTGSSMKVCWGKDNTPDNDDSTPAVEVVLYYDPTYNFNFSDVQVGRVAIDPRNDRTDTNEFKNDDPSAGDCSLGGVNYEFQNLGNLTFNSASDFNVMPSTCVNQNGCLLFARIKFLYNTDNSQPVGIQVQGDTLPSQGKLIESTGTSVDSKAKVDVNQTFKNPLPIFESAVFSQVGGLEK